MSVSCPFVLPAARRGKGEASQGSAEAAQPAAGETHESLQRKQRPSTLRLSSQGLHRDFFPKKPSSPGHSGTITEKKSALGASLCLSVPVFPAVPHPKGFEDSLTSQERPPRHPRHLDLGPGRLEFGGKGIRPGTQICSHQVIAQVLKIINNYFFIKTI